MSNKEQKKIIKDIDAKDEKLDAILQKKIDQTLAKKAKDDQQQKDDSSKQNDKKAADDNKQPAEDSKQKASPPERDSSDQTAEPSSPPPSKDDNPPPPYKGPSSDVLKKRLEKKKDEREKEQLKGSTYSDQANKVKGNLPIVDTDPQLKEMWSNKMKQYLANEGIFDKLRGWSSSDIAKKIEGMSDQQLQDIADRAGPRSARRVLSPKDYALWQAAREKLGITEQEVQEAILTPQQRRKRAMVFRRYRAKIAAARKRSMRRRPTQNMLQKRAKRRAVGQVRKRVSSGKSYKDMSSGERRLVDTKVQRRRGLVKRISRKLIPQMRNEDICNAFDKFLVEQTGAPTKRFHQARNKDGTIKTDQRFRAFKKKPHHKQESVSMDPELREMAEHALQDSKLLDTIASKSAASGIAEDVLLKVFKRGMISFSEQDTPLTSVQYSMNRVNSFISGGYARKLDEDLMESNNGWIVVHNDTDEPSRNAMGKVIVYGNEGSAKAALNSFHRSQRHKWRVEPNFDDWN